MAMTGDDSKLAVGRRLRALRLAFGLSAEHLGRQGFTDARHVLDAEAGLIMPSRSVIHYFWRKWQISSDFITEGANVDLLPVRVEQRIFDQLSKI